MSHFGKSGPPDIRDTYPLLVLNITFRTSADDLFPLFDKYGKVIDVFIPRNREASLLFAASTLMRRKRLSRRRVVDGREIMVQFAKYGPNAERILNGKVSETSLKTYSKKRGRSRSCSPHPRNRDEYRDKDSMKRSRSRSRDRHDRDKYCGKERDHRHRSMSCSS